MPIFYRAILARNKQYRLNNSLSNHWILIMKLWYVWNSRRCQKWFIVMYKILLTGFEIPCVLSFFSFSFFTHCPLKSQVLSNATLKAVDVPHKEIDSSDKVRSNELYDFQLIFKDVWGNIGTTNKVNSSINLMNLIFDIYARTCYLVTDMYFFFWLSICITENLFSM